MMDMNLPTLYKRTSTGKIQMWEIAVSGVGDLVPDVGCITTTYGLLDGKQQEAQEYITEGKNVGKANETTPYDQAQAEAKSQWEKKVKKGYVESLDDAEQGKINSDVIVGGIEPMLAHSYDKQGHKIKFPAYVQPKLDGHRCIAVIQDGKATLWSRTRKKITGVPHIERELERMQIEGRLPNFVLDGELYNHDYREKFEELTSFIRQETPKPGHEVVHFWVYDVIDSTSTFDERNETLVHLLDALIAFGVDCIEPVETELVDNAESMIEVFGEFINEGFEGLMVRNRQGKYKHGRSYDLQKVKVFADAEYEVIDVTEGRGKMAGKAMFHCAIPEYYCTGCETYTSEPGVCHGLPRNKLMHKEFRVKMMGALDDLAHYLDHKEDYIGRELTVKYQNLSADGIPRFPVATRFREDV